MSIASPSPDTKTDFPNSRRDGGRLPILGCISLNQNVAMSFAEREERFQATTTNPPFACKQTIDQKDTIFQWMIFPTANAMESNTRSRGWRMDCQSKALCRHTSLELVNKSLRRRYGAPSKRRRSHWWGETTEGDRLSESVGISDIVDISAQSLSFGRSSKSSLFEKNFDFDAPPSRQSP